MSSDTFITFFLQSSQRFNSHKRVKNIKRTKKLFKFMSHCEFYKYKKTFLIKIFNVKKKQRMYHISIFLFYINREREREIDRDRERQIKS